MGNLTIKMQMMLASLLAIIIFIATSIYIASVNSDVLAIEKKSEVKLNEKMLLKDARYHIVQIQQFLTDASLTGNDSAVDEALENKKAVIKISDSLESIEPSFTRKIEAIKKSIELLYSTGLEMKNEYTTKGQRMGNIIMTRAIDGFDARSEHLSNQFEDLVLEVDHAVNKAKLDLKVAQSNLETVNFVGSIIQIIIILAISGLVLYRVIPAITRLNKNILQLASGDKDLSRRLTIRKKDELGEIAGSVNHFTSELDSMTAAIKQASDRLKNITGTFQQSSAESAQGMLEVHNHTDMLATAITEMASTVNEVARNTEHAAEIANSARDTTLSGQAIVSDSVEIINTLAKDIDESAGQIQSLVALSEQIGDIINVIKSISDQTNLLALNAAIEAARAGDAGRGFAVVADEVRSLAKNTQDSAAEIENMISQIQQESQRVSVSMQNNIAKAATTVEKAQQAGHSLSDIANSVMELADVNMQIATASEQQSAVSEEINKSILEVANIANDTLETTNKVGISSIECSFAAAEVNDLIGQFKTTEFEHEEDSNKLVNWTEAFSVHVPSIDQQHKTLFDLMNDVYQLILANKLDNLTEPLDKLVAFAKKHLQDEEIILKQANYPDFDAHKKIHIKLLADMNSLYQQAQTGDINKLFELVMFLKNWLIDHIYKVDMKYSEHLVSRGVK